ncbi:MAG: MetQ/NlpA family ABC transporter substrate-binding protein [Paenibacillus macerans]|nr:MetQ/NlpA family ABC transporter substrate-binding protein [Paenibacillus macerans]MDU7476693.1 MetQ/NlpA family ABC transporter substrate-binding protein [Paenibacillus macerans]MEC0141661.1 MetQ/NlpA family ABC transporter substrate-binding protein [Paenibacillus macerans]MEC0333729.1 MetQ/NlpA family ABC transporter substrate-binding protein [Paenibacillus macerans]
MKWMMSLALLALVLTACGGGGGQDRAAKGAGNEAGTNGATSAAASAETTTTTLKVATLIPPMTEILELIKPQLKEEGIDLELVVLSDNVQPNDALANKEVDANFFQHVPYMEQYNESKNAHLAAVQPVYHAVYGAYSKKYKSMEELPDGATIAIANDPSNIARSLMMLDKAGVIKLKEGAGLEATQGDIVENSHNYKFEEVDLLMLARMLDDADLVLMTPAYASPLGLTPKKDALLTETVDSAFAITLVAREDNKDSEPVQKLAKAISSPEVKQFLEQKYDEIALPAF